MANHPNYLAVSAEKTHHAGSPPTVIVRCSAPWILPGDQIADDGTCPYDGAVALAERLLPGCALQGECPKPGEKTPLHFTVPEEGE